MSRLYIRGCPRYLQDFLEGLGFKADYFDGSDLFVFDFTENQNGRKFKPSRKIRIKNRESWFKMIILSAFSIVIIVKLLSSSFSINLSDLKFTDILSLLLALFSMGISIAFYFKATDTSNEFYNNTYRFTQDMSKILERMESGFGEKLSNIQDSVANEPTTTKLYPKIPPNIYEKPETSDNK